MNAWWTKYLPDIFKEWLHGRQQLHNVIGNTWWLIFDRGLRMAVGLLVGAWVTRYLGPVQFGELAYIISFLAFFQVVVNLQAEGFIVRDIAQKCENAPVILGTTLWLRLVFGVFAWLAATGLMFLLHHDNKQLCLLTAIAGASLAFQASDTIDLWFQSQSQSKRTVIAKMVAYLFSNGIKVILLLFKAPMLAFVSVILVECVISTLGLTIAYRKFPTNNRWRASLSQAKTYLNTCWPFIVSGLMTTTFSRIDQIMLKEMMGEKVLGLYAAVLPISNAWTILPTTLVTSLAPYIAQKMNQDVELYQDALAKIFRIFAILALLGSVLTAVVSPWIIMLFYGAEFQPSAAILSIYIFINVFIFLGTAQYLWVINSNVRTVTLVGTFLSAIINITSNAFLIRKYGGQGAAYSALITECVSVVIIPCLFRKDLRAIYKKAFFLATKT